MYKSTYRINIENEENNEVKDKKKGIPTAAKVAGGAALLAGSGWTAKKLIDGIKANAYANGYAAAPKFSLSKSIIYSLIGTYGLNKIIALARGRSVSDINWASLFS